MNGLLECKQLFNENGFNFPEEFYSDMPLFIQPFPVSQPTQTLKFVQTSNPQQNLFFPDNSGNFDSTQAPLKPHSFQPMRMEEEPTGVSGVSDIQVTQMEEEIKKNVPAPHELRFTDLEEKKVPLNYTCVVTGKELTFNKKADFQQYLLNKFIERKQQLKAATNTNKKPFSPGLSPVLSQKKSPHPSPKKAASSFMIDSEKYSPSKQFGKKLQPKINQSSHIPSQLLNETKIQHQPMSPHIKNMKMKPQQTSPALSPINPKSQPQKQFKHPLKYQQTIKQLSDKKLEQITQAHNTTPIPKMKSFNLMNDAPQQQSNQQQQPNVPILPEQPSYPISDYYNSDDNARAVNRKKKRGLVQAWTHKGNLTPFVDQTSNMDPNAIFDPHPVVVDEKDTSLVGDVKSRRQRSMAWS
ncbi:Inner centromere protein ARK-binding domain-containing protein [Entamoeba marina]